MRDHRFMRRTQRSVSQNPGKKMSHDGSMETKDAKNPSRANEKAELDSAYRPPHQLSRGFSAIEAFDWSASC
jgi:hypothetical protein